MNKKIVETLVKGIIEFEADAGSQRLADHNFTELLKEIQNQEEITDEDVENIGEQIAEIYFYHFIENMS